MNEFKKLGLSQKIVDVLEGMHITTPTQIQEASIPSILEGKDVIGTAATGSGKTLAFSAVFIEKFAPEKKVQALVLAPTRELAEQITKAIRTFSRNHSLKVHEVYGGVSFDNQVRNIREADVIVGTPGRILDHLQRGTLKLSDINILVLDEADRMVDMGFLPDVEKIISQCPTKRQTLLFSATNSQDVQYIERKYMKSPEHITVEQYVDASKLSQYYYNTPNHVKFSLLVHLLKQDKSGIIMIFCNTRRNVDLLAVNLKRYGILSYAIHGGLEQNKRSRVMENFHAAKAGVLICTDVAARGLDIKGVTHVYNYDIPKTSEDYIHRIGRTARAGKEGMAVNLVSNKDYDNFRRVLSDDSLVIEEKEVPEIEQLSPNFKRDDRDDRRGPRGRSDSRGRSGPRPSGRDRATGRFSSGDRRDGRSSGHRRDSRGSFGNPRRRR